MDFDVTLGSAYIVSQRKNLSISQNSEFLDW